MARNLINLMKAAIALAESLNFSRAARKLHISQPTLTKNIVALEDWIGVTLFERDRQSVALTDAGQAFVEEARHSVLHSERAIQAARVASQNFESVLNVGRSPYIDPFLVSTLLSIRLPLYPHLRLELSSQFSCDLVHEVLAGTMDLAIVTEPPPSPLLAATKVAESCFYIVMSKENDLAYKPSLSLSDLGGQEWVLFERGVHPPLYDQILRIAAARHITPRQIRHVMTAEEAFPFVSVADSIAFLTKSGALRIAKGEITLRPLFEESLPLRTYLAGRVDNKSKIVSEFMRAYVRKLSQFVEAA